MFGLRIQILSKFNQKKKKKFVQIKKVLRSIVYFQKSVLRYSV